MSSNGWQVKRNVSRGSHDERVPNRTRALDEAARLAERLHATIADELREARLALGLTQAEVGRALAVNRSHVSRVERGRAAGMTVERLTRHAAVLGLRTSVKFYPAGAPLRDAAQARYIARFIARIGHAWRVRLDVPIPLRGDLRGIDILLQGSCVIAVEVVTRLRDLQALLRAAQLKQRDVGAERLIIVIAGTAANRRVLDQARATLLGTFDLDTRRTLAKLAAGQDPGRDAVVVLD